MRKIYLLAASMFVGAFTFGQTNLSFETWGPSYVPGAGIATDKQAPENWETLNFANANLSAFGVNGNAATNSSGAVIDPVSNETDNPTDGNSYIKVTNFNLTGFAGFGMPDGPQGSFAAQTFASTTVYENMTLDIKYDVLAGEKATIIFQALNITPTDTTFAGGGMLELSGGSSQSTWTNVTVPITWQGGVTPTHYDIIIAASEAVFSSTATAVVDSWVAADNIVLTEDPTSSIVENNAYSVNVYPNPASDILNINAEGVNGTVTIASITGQVVTTANVNNGAKVDVSNLNNGVYIYTILDENGNSVKTNKLVIQK
ncbi:MAG: T9SS type A sorting domain-containing protein [Brumimicrobium sp.]